MLQDQKQAMTVVCFLFFFFPISIEPSSPAWQLTVGKSCLPDLQSELFDASSASQQAEVEHHALGLIKIALTTLGGTLEVGEAVFFVFPARQHNYDQLFNPSPGGSRKTASFLRPQGQREHRREKKKKKLYPPREGGERTNLNTLEGIKTLKLREESGFWAVIRQHPPVSADALTLICLALGVPG